MKLTILMSATLMTLIVFTACNKDETSFDRESNSILSGASDLDQMVTLTGSDYKRIEAETLERPDENTSWTSGVIEYVQNGIVSARVDFSKGEDGKAKCTDKDGSREFSLKKGGGHKGDFEKVIIEPLVKLEDCEYIVAGTVQFFKDEEWMATIDFGDGTCDDLATKETADGIETFSLDDVKKGCKGKKHKGPKGSDEDGPEENATSIAE